MSTISGDANETENENEITKEDATDPLKPKDRLCRLCRQSGVGSDELRPNGLRCCKCNELSPYYNSSPPVSNLDNEGLVFRCPKELHYAHHPETNVTQILDSRERENGSVDTSPQKERSFLPLQGMDTGQYPRALFRQYYPNRNKVYTFDLLPLPFIDGLKYKEMHSLAMDNEDVQKKWKDFLYNSPDNDLHFVAYPNDKFWRWEKYLRYSPDENRDEFRYRMQTGPKYDGKGRLPITGEDLQIFREMKTMRRTDRKYTLKKGDGTRKK